MKKKRIKRAWWEKEWDKDFGKFLKETAVQIPATGYGWTLGQVGKEKRFIITFNSLAKDFIRKIVQVEIQKMCDRHNLIAIAMDKSGQKNKEGVAKVKALIEVFTRTEERAKKYKKELQKILEQ